MEFDLEDFTTCPSVAKLGKYKKAELLEIADHFKIAVPPTVKKTELKELLCETLSERGLLEPSLPEKEESVAASPGRPASLPSPPASHGMSVEELQLTLQIKEAGLKEKKLEVEALHLKVRLLELERLPATSSQTQSSTSQSTTAFDVSKHIALVPPFRESEVDSYFTAFERIAATLHWPKSVWSLLLQCKLVGKAQEVCASLAIEDSLQYDVVKATVLRAYELVPEAYRQKFRKHEKTANQTYVEFAREKGVLFDKWCQASKVTAFEELKELVLLEEFKNRLPDKLAVYLSEQKVTSLSAAAVLADEFTLTHKTVFSPSVRPEPAQADSRPKSPKNGRRSAFNSSGNRECFYCHEQGHLIAVCPSLKKKEQLKSSKNPTPVSLIQSTPLPQTPHATKTHKELVDQSFEPFVSHGSVSLSEEGDSVPIVILRDTGAKQSLIRGDVLPFADESYSGLDVLAWGIEMNVMRVPLHFVHLTSKFVTGKFQIAVRPQLPIAGIHLILGNDLAGGQVFPAPCVTEKPTVDTCAPDSCPLFPACAVTRAQARKFEDVVDLSDSLLNACDSPISPAEKTPVTLELQPSDEMLTLCVNKDELKKAQKEDESLLTCWSYVNNPVCEKSVLYHVDDGVLMRRWCPRSDSALETAHQIVVPKSLRPQVLSLAHDHSLSGHLGVTKTYKRVLRYFFWPGLKSDVASFCRSCHTCQVSGKPNQVIPVAPLKPIPVMGEPFEHVIVDCVGPLPKTKSGNQYILTMMCTATRYPEAVPLRSLKSRAIVKALVKFFSTFGLPKYVQSDQGSNFMSKLFTQVLSELGVKHRPSSAYHPQSQGALERFHQTLKSMLCKFCTESHREWDEGLPLLLFAIRETTQESVGFSPADLVFGHTVRGPLRMLRERWLLEKPTPENNVLDYVSSFREKLHKACSFARDSLAAAQSKMKSCFDKKSVVRSFQPGDRVLVLLPLVGSGLQAKFSGPYVVDRKISETDYVILTPDRKKKQRVCHINMLKSYVDRNESSVSSPQVSPVAAAAVVSSPYNPSDDELDDRRSSASCARLRNSEILGNLDAHLTHLSPAAKAEVGELINKFPSLFGDIPSQTNVLCHDIDVGNHAPIKQHAYRVSPEKRALMKQEADYLLENGLAVPSSSPWSSPSLLVSKPDKTFRFCNDYRKVNSITTPDSFPLPRMEDCIDRVGPAKYVTKLDLLKGYWQVPLTARASEISAFVTPDHFLQYNVMPFGLRNAPATFQRLMNLVLSGVDHCEVYLDDIVVYTDSWTAHLKTLTEVFERLSRASLTLNLAKCEFGKAVVVYLGKQVGQGRVCPVTAKIQAILDFPAPQTRRELRRFLGMAGYYRAFCKNFSDVVAPLTNLVSPKCVFRWSESCRAAFEAAKALLCSAPVLAAPDFTRPFQLEVDASALGAGAVLLQTDADGVDRPVCYFSKKFRKHQLHYSTIEKEALALLLALQHFEIYVTSSSVPTVIYSDHNPLVFLSQMRNSNQRLMRWSLMIQDFSIHIRHKKGSENVIADALSRAL